MDIKNKRDRLITNTDWTQVPDSPLSAEKMTEFVKYRQLLRDIPQTYADPDSIVWPTMPSI
ncbi:hypothetical protein C5469_21460 [Photorhabdus cinerea]|uniref:Phage tail assembly chaperone-like domain-containing protein n=2 Tax=Photorhabdus cinerea TaxID=471575 RepID=A0A7X5TJG3_9GAMM|nr:hypothetical protein [Photorhabdus cinerea]